jgi:protocatechuate 3,4-dioxygenase beta subunit
MVGSVNTRRAIDRVISALAVVACCSFVVGLFDVALSRPVVAAYAPPVPDRARERDARLVVDVTEGVDLPLSCLDGDESAGGAAACDPTAVPEDATGVAGATVRVFWVSRDRYYLAAVQRTDVDGRVDLSGLPRGRVWVLAQAPGRARASTQLVLGPEPRSVVLGLPRAFQLRVAVHDEAGEGILGATVLVTAADPLPYGRLTDDAGVAGFVRLPPAPWIVKASAPGYESVSRAGLRGDTTIVLRNLGSLEVRVRGPNGQPVSGASVTIAGSSLWPARRVDTDHAGSARIAGLLAGVYDLRAHHGDLVSETLMGLTLERGARETVTLQLQPGRVITVVVTEGPEDDALVIPGADVVLAEGGLSSFPLRGRTGTDGTVVLGPIAPGPATVGARAQGFVARGAIPLPDEMDGRVRLALLRGATLRGTVVDAHDYPVDGASIEVIGNDSYGYPIADTPTLLAFRQTHFAWALSGPVPLLPAGELGVMPGPVPPIPPPGGAVAMGWSRGAAPAADPQESFDPWVTRADGTFRAYPVTPGRVRAVVRHPDYVGAVSEAVTLGPGGVADVKVVLTAGGTLEGRIFDPRGFPVASARVDVISVAGTYERTTLTAQDGTFAFAAVPTEVWISVAHPDDLSTIVVRELATVEEGARTEVELTLPEPRAPVRIRVQGDDEQPVDGAQVLVLSLDPSAPLRRTQFADAEGSITIDGARGLDLRIVVEASGWARQVRNVSKAPAEVDVKLRRGVVCRGTVTAVRGRRYVAGARVTIVSGGLRRATVTDDEGAYEIRDVEPGPVRLIVSHPDYATREVAAKVRRTGRADRALELPAVDLQEAGSVEGRVVDDQGEPVRGARVGVGLAPAFLPVGVTPPSTTTSDSQGRFVLEGLSPGTIDLEAYAPDVGRGTASGVKIDSGSATREVKISLVPEAGAVDPAASASLAATLGERGSGEADIVVVHVADGSEAERGGLQVGDVIVEVDGVAPRDMADARVRLSGQDGSDVVVQVRRKGRTLKLRLVRERVRR